MCIIKQIVVIYITVKSKMCIINKIQQNCRDLTVHKNFNEWILQ
jgi:hypothetical protein